MQTGMVATEPLSEKQWSTLGFHHNETFADCTRAATYLQRTADQRLVIGARGHYLPGGVPQHALADSSAMRRTREGIALGLFPQLSGVRFTHSWGQCRGASRLASHVCMTLTRGWPQPAAILVRAWARAFYSDRRWRSC